MVSCILVQQSSAPDLPLDLPSARSSSPSGPQPRDLLPIGPTPAAAPSPPPKSHPPAAVTVAEGALQLGQRRFPLVHSAAVLLRLLDQYLQLQQTAPQSTAELARRVVEIIKVI